ncbi:hypothetical protein BDI4_670044 [Burkholderia diffusa]|nr:hypothetical protein BDI4_670044 [Burkholderia diffusa]
MAHLAKIRENAGEFRITPSQTTDQGNPSYFHFLALRSSKISRRQLNYLNDTFLESAHDIRIILISFHKIWDKRGLTMINGWGERIAPRAGGDVGHA